MNTALLLKSLLFILFAGGKTPVSPVHPDRPDWVLRQEKGALRVYTRPNPDSGIQEVRITTRINARIGSFLTALSDVSAYQTWVYKCSEARLLETVNEQEFYYYAKTDLPFPVSDRDLVVHSRQWQDESGVIHSVSNARPEYLPAKKGVVRIHSFRSYWRITPAGPGQVAIDYEVKTNPGGNIPAWIINLGITSGPVKTMEKLAEIAQHERYRDAPLPAYVRP